MVFIQILWEILPGYIWIEKQKQQDSGMIFKEEISGLQNIFMKYGTVWSAKGDKTP